MSDTLESLRHKIASATDLQSVVRTMKALAASSIGQYERSVAALADYHRTVELGLGACLREQAAAPHAPVAAPGRVGAIVFGSDQGLVGQFNDVVAEHALKTLAPLGGKPLLWAVGERVHARLVDAGQAVAGRFPVPQSVQAIAPLVGQIELTSQAQDVTTLYLVYQRPDPHSGYGPVAERVLPLDAAWEQRLAAVPWPTRLPPEVLGTGVAPLRALIREYVFISIFRACAASLASENASRLAAMQRADKNIDDLLETLNTGFHRLRQGAIDEELFDVVSSYEVLARR